MEFFFRPSESQLFAGAIIQSVFEHFNVLVVYGLHGASWVHGVSANRCSSHCYRVTNSHKGPSKVSRTIESRVNQGISKDSLPLS